MKFIRVLRHLPLRYAVLTILAATAIEFCPARPCQAVDSPMVCAWRRTFWAQDCLKSPLRGYFMPRHPNCDCWGGSYQFGITSYAPATDGMAPAEMVRLGQIPNELSMGGPPVATPGR